MQPYPSANSNGNVGNSGANPNQLFNSISSNGQPPENSQQSSDDAGAASPAELAIQRIGGFISTFGTLSESYPQANKLAEDVKKALNTWLDAVVSSTSQQGSAESNSI